MTAPNKVADIGIILLAAGSGNRFGSDKRQATLPDNRTLLSASLDRIPGSFTRKILVLRQDDVELAKQFQDHWQICRAPHPETGMANSLVSGIKMAENWEAALIALGDMPFIAPTTFSTLQQALQTKPIVVPTCRGQRGNPVGFSKQFFTEMTALEGDRGARALLEKYAAQCCEIETGDEGILRDVDYPDALE